MKMRKILILMFLFFVLNCNAEKDNKIIEIIIKSNTNTIALGEEIVITIEMINKSNESVYVCIDKKMFKPKFSFDRGQLVSEYGKIYSRSIEYPKEMFELLEKNGSIKISYTYSLINDSINYIENPYSGLILYDEIDEENVLLFNMKKIEINSVYDCGSYILEAFFKYYPNSEIVFFSTKVVTDSLVLSIDCE